MCMRGPQTDPLARPWRSDRWRPAGLAPLQLEHAKADVRECEAAIRDIKGPLELGARRRQVTRLDKELTVVVQGVATLGMRLAS